MKTKVVITVDVEPSIAGAFSDPARFEPLIHEPVWGEVDGKSQALGFLLATLKKYHLTATFFVETAHVAYFPEHAMGAYVRRLVDAGQDVQLHLHPSWLSYRNDSAKRGGRVSDQCSDLTDDRLAALILEGRERIRAWTGKAPDCMRTGNFSVSRSIYETIHEAGIRASSNICLAVFRPPQEALWMSGGLQQIDGVVEMPVTCFTDRGPIGRGRLRPMQVTACGFEELRTNLINLHAAGGSIAVIVTHPFEFLKWSGNAFSRLRPNQLVQRRFDRLCAFLAENRDRFDTVPIETIKPDDIISEPAIELSGNPLSSIRRSIENFVNDRMPL